jgi:hypothetical protein
MKDILSIVLIFIGGFLVGANSTNLLPLLGIILLQIGTIILSK